MSASNLEAATKFQLEGNLVEAESLYRKVLEVEPEHEVARHNLGIVLLASGKLEEGLKLIEPIIRQRPDDGSMHGSIRTVATTLYSHHHWEAALPWLNRACLNAPDDAALHQMRERAAPRDYLVPEVFDPGANETLLRYSPRESDTYVYTIDIVGTCNLRCPSCPVGNYTAADRSTGFMPVGQFKDIIEKIKHESPASQPQIWLYNWGEPLLHPDIAEIIGVVKAAGFSVHLSSNLNTEHGIQKVAKAAPSELKISLSGFTDETYSFSHRRGNITLVKSNMYALRYYLDKYKSETRVWVGHHLYKHNYHELDEVASWCKALNFEHRPTQAFFQPLEKLVAIAEGETLVSDDPVLQQLLIHPKDNLANIKNHRSGRYDCELRFNQTVINHDGNVALCCSVYDQPNMLNMRFLEHSHDEIQASKYTHNFCKTCRSNGCDYSVAEVMDRK